MRRHRGLGLDAPMQGLRCGIGLGGGVPALQLRGFLGRYQREVSQGQRGVFQPLLQHIHQAIGQGLHLVCLEVRLVVDAVQARRVVVAIAAQVNRQRQRLMVVGHLDRPGRRLAVAKFMVVLLIGHRQVEQLATVGAQQTQLAIHLAQRETLMSEILLELVAHATHQGAERQVVAELQAHGTDLGEKPQGRTKACIGTVEYRQPHHPLLALAGAAEVQVHRRQ